MFRKVEEIREYIKGLMGNSLNFALPIPLTIKAYTNTNHVFEDYEIIQISRNSLEGRPRLITNTSKYPIELSYCSFPSLRDEFNRLKDYYKNLAESRKRTELIEQIKPHLGLNYVEKLKAHNLIFEQVLTDKRLFIEEFDTYTEEILKGMDILTLDKVLSGVKVCENILKKVAIVDAFGPYETLSIQDKELYHRVQVLREDGVVNWELARVWKTTAEYNYPIIPVIDYSWACKEIVPVLKFLREHNYVAVNLIGDSSSLMNIIHLLYQEGYRLACSCILTCVADYRKDEEVKGLTFVYEGE